jgi:hypothetical protein
MPHASLSDDQGHLFGQKHVHLHEQASKTPVGILYALM